MSKTNQKNQQGVSLYIAVIVLAIMLAMGLGLSAITSSQIKLIRGMGDSVVALYAADTGIERALYNIRRELEIETWPISDNLQTDCSYEVDKVACDTKTCLRSVGSYKGTKRAIEATY